MRLSQLSRNIGSGVACSLLGALVMAVSYPLYLHYLGYDRFGVWLVMTTVLSLAQLGNLGIAPALTKLVAEERALGNQSGIEEYVASALALVSGTGVLVFLGVFLLRYEIISSFRIPAAEVDMAYKMLPWIGLLSAYAFLTEALSATLSGLGRADIANYLQAAAHLFGTAISAVLLWLGMGSESLLWGSAAGAGLLGAFSLLQIHKLSRIQFVSYPAWNRIRVLVRFGGWVFATSWINLLLNPLNKLLLSHFAGVAALPVYELAWNGSMRIRSLLEVGLRALLPEVSRLAASGGQESAKASILRLLERSRRMMAASGVPVFAICIALAPYVLQIWLGRQYRPDMTTALRLLLGATFFSLLGVPAFYTLLAMGHARINFLGSALLPVTNVLFVAAYYAAANVVTIGSVCAGVMAGMIALTLFVNWRVSEVLR